MTDLTKQLEQALIPMHPNDRIRFADMSYGIQCHADRLAPLHAALLKCVEALDVAHDYLEGTVDCDKSGCDPGVNWHAPECCMEVSFRTALADLRKALEECK